METATGWAFHHKRILLATGAMLVLFILIVTRPATITGHFSAETYDQRTNMMADGSAAYALDGTLLTHLQISGTINGPGEVRIYLTEGITRKLVYTNARNTENKITGSAIGDTKTGQTTTKLTITELEPELPPLERTGEPRALPNKFTRTCQDTCILNPAPGTTYKLLIQTEPGTSVKISAIHYSTLEPSV